MDFLSLKTIIILMICFSIVKYLHKPLPKHLDDKIRTRILFMFIHIYYIISLIREYLGYGSRYLGLRMFEWTKYVPNWKEFKGTKFRDIRIGEHNVRVRTYMPVNATEHGLENAAIIFIHGGGWALGTVEIYHMLTASICRSVGCKVFVIDYRRAPEHPFPTPLNDCIESTKYIFEHGSHFKIDTSKVVVMGDSAGGNLTATLCLKLRDTRYKFRPLLQILIYPVVQMIDLQLPSYQDPYKLLTSQSNLARYISFYAGAELVDIYQLAANEHVSRETKKKYAYMTDLLPEPFRANYHPHAMKGDRKLFEHFEKFITDPYFAPLMANSHKDLPEALIWTAGYDVLRDEGIMYAEKLKKDGVKVTWYHKENAIHGVFSFDLPTGRHYRKEIYKYLREKLQQ